MNILFFLIPKSEVAYIFEDETLRQTLEKMEHRKYSCIPILTMDGKYLGTISEGDLLWGMRRADIHDPDHGDPTPCHLQTGPCRFQYGRSPGSRH